MNSMSTVLRYVFVKVCETRISVESQPHACQQVRGGGPQVNKF